MDTREFLETQGKDGQDLKGIKREVLDNAFYVTQDMNLFEEPSEQVLDYLGTAIIDLSSYFGHTITKEDVSIPSHYNGEVDVIQFLQEEYFTREQFVSAMIFNIVKYTTRLGRKDDTNKELVKIFTYFVRLREGLSLYE
ncbi:hypothetical protein F10086_170 [Staphylococcus phage vB_SauM_JDF86]|nr:hypothetical protein F10086_170 [Staphylococcus phage vB_SauM_JDF86]